MKKSIPVLLLLFLLSCSKDDDKGSNTTNFDRQGMLQNIGQNFIVPAYEQANNSATAMADALYLLGSEPNIPNLQDARSKFVKAYEDWQKISPFEFGPAAEVSLKSNVNIYPIDQTKVKANINGGGANFDELSQKDAKGFPAIDFLLFSYRDSVLINVPGQGNEAINRLIHLGQIGRDVSDRISSVYNSWNPSNGNYLSTFISQNGTDVGSSLGKLVNAINQHLEVDLRDGKVGIPLGVRSAGLSLPFDVEALFSEYSLILLRNNLETLESIYLGNSFENQTGIGLDDHLIAADASELNQRIINQFATVYDALDQVESVQVSLYLILLQLDTTPVSALYDELQKLVVLFKVDMPSRLGVLITYQDNDGD